MLLLRCFRSNHQQYYILQLEFAIRKNNSVFTRSRVSITGFVLSKVNTSIFISHGVLVLVFCRLIISWFVITWFVGSRFVYWSSMVSGSVIYWSWLVSWCWVIHRSMPVGL